MLARKSYDGGAVSTPRRKQRRLIRIITSPNAIISNFFSPEKNRPSAHKRHTVDWTGVPPIHHADAGDLAAAPPDPLPAEASLFPAFMPSPAVTARLPRGYILRALQRGDYDRGFAALKNVGPLTRAAWDERCAWLAARADEYTVLVVADAAGGVVAAGTLLVERRFVHGGMLVGHVRDLVIAPGQKGRNLGLRLLEQLTQTALDAGCAKTLVTTQDVNEAFYKQRGFRRTQELEMAHVFRHVLCASTSTQGLTNSDHSRTSSFIKDDEKAELRAAVRPGISPVP